MLIFEGHVVALVFHLSDVDPLLDVETHGARGRLPLHEDAVALVVEVVEYEAQVLEEGEFEASVGLGGLFPRHGGVAVAARGYTALAGRG